MVLGTCALEKVRGLLKEKLKKRQVAALNERLGPARAAPTPFGTCWRFPRHEDVTPDWGCGEHEED